MRKEKGITLIALIITIIVMLILVAVTITVALNGGVFDNAKNASDKTQRQAEKEELIAAMVGAYDSTGSFATSNVGTLPSGARWCNEDTEVWSADLDVNPTGNGDWIITPNNNKFYVDSSGSVLDEKPHGTGRYNITLGNLNEIDWSELDDGQYLISFTDTSDKTSYLMIFIESGELDGVMYGDIENFMYEFITENGKWEYEDDEETEISILNVTYTTGGTTPGDDELFNEIDDDIIGDIILIEPV